MAVVRDLRAILAVPGFRRLFLVRLISQAGDGMFQVGLASLLFFSPQSAGTAAGIAGAFTVMFLPFTVVGPFAGVLLDRWSRQQVLVWGNLVRGLITAIMAVLMFALGGVGWLAGFGLAALSVNRFLLAALSAGLPRVLAGDLLLTANSLAPTLGAGAAFLGGGIGFALNVVLPPGRMQDGAALVCAALVMWLGALAATRLGRTQLGPEHPATTRIRDDISIVARDLASGARYLVARRTPWQGLLAILGHRFIYGIVFLAAILISRNLLGEPGDMAGGMANFAIIMGLIGLGGAIAMFATPIISPRTGPQVWVALMLFLGAASQLLLATSPDRWVIFAGTTLLGIAAQGMKIAVDTVVQRDTADDYRGRAFAFYDVLFNAGFVAAALLAALFVPDVGWSRPVFVTMAVAYVAMGLAMWLRGAREPRQWRAVKAPAPPPGSVRHRGEPAP